MCEVKFNCVFSEEFPLSYKVHYFIWLLRLPLIFAAVTLLNYASKRLKFLKAAS